MDHALYIHLELPFHINTTFEQSIRRRRRIGRRQACLGPHSSVGRGGSWAKITDCAAVIPWRHSENYWHVELVNIMFVCCRNYEQRHFQREPRWNGDCEGHRVLQHVWAPPGADHRKGTCMCITLHQSSVYVTRTSKGNFSNWAPGRELFKFVRPIAA